MFGEDGKSGALPSSPSIPPALVLMEKGGARREPALPRGLGRISDTNWPGPIVVSES